MIVKVDNLSLSFGDKKILDDISFTLNSGDYLSVIGPNGAGKSTLIKCLCRLYTDYNGSISIADKELDKYERKELAKIVSYVPQSTGQPPVFKVGEFVLMSRYPHLSPFSSVTSYDREHVTKALETTGIAHLRDRKLTTLSGGERQLVYISAAIAQEADIIILDEPNTFLDYKHQSEVMNLLSELNKEHNLTIICINHNINEACRRSNKVLALKNGKKFFSGTADDILKDNHLNELFETEFMIVDHPSGAGKMVIA